MDEKGYTVLQIAEEGLKKFKVGNSEEIRSSVLDALCKKIRRVIAKNQIEPIGKGKSTPKAKRQALIFSKESKDILIDELLFDYFINLTQDEAYKNLTRPEVYNVRAEELNGAYEDEALLFLNSSNKQQNLMISNVYTDQYDKRIYAKIQNRKKEIMIEAIFSKDYLLKLDDLVEDINQYELITIEKQGEFTGADMRLKEKLEDWRNYVKSKDENIYTKKRQ